MKEMVAVICKCAKHNKLFGIRFDQINSRTWEYAWAFPLKDGADRREQGFSTTIGSSMSPDQRMREEREISKSGSSSCPASSVQVSGFIP